MRAREMMTRLDRIPKQRDGDRKTWDVSLLSPEKQDRLHELLELVRASKGINSNSLDAAFAELDELVRDLPRIGPDDPEQGPLIKVPHTLVRYWAWNGEYPRKWRDYDFLRLSKVQTLRFVELCEQYGFSDHTDGPVKEQMLPLHAWESCDRSEFEGMLDIAASSDRQR